MYFNICAFVRSWEVVSIMDKIRAFNMCNRGKLSMSSRMRRRFIVDRGIRIRGWPKRTWMKAINKDVVMVRYNEGALRRKNRIYVATTPRSWVKCLLVVVI